MTCVYCPHEIKNGDMFWDLHCQKHMAHASHNTSRCLVCSPAPGSVAPAGSSVSASAQTPAAQVASAVPLATISVSRAELDARARRLANNSARRSEPLKPYEPSSTVGSWFGSLLGVAARVAEASVPDDESSNPAVLLDAGVPLKVLVAKHGFDITELINDPPGVTIGDFFRNRYTIGEMCDAFASRMNPDEGMAVLYALGMTDEFLTAMPKQCQIPIMRARLGLTPETLVKYLEYKFVPGRWTIPQMLEVGLTMPMVMEQGLRTAEEWAQLRDTARTASDLQRFGVTPFLEAQMIRPMQQAPLTATEQYVPTTFQPSSMSLSTTPATAPVYGPIIPTAQWPPPGVSVPSAAKTTTPVARSWSSRLPIDVLTSQQLPSNQMPVATTTPTTTTTEWSLPDTTPKLVEKPALVLLPHHQTNKPVKYALK